MTAPAAPDFVHLHVHSDYSLLDGACRHDALLKRAEEFEMHSVAVTDHGNLMGAMEFYKKARERKVKPILGCEVYTVPGEDEGAHRKKGQAAGDYNHLLLLCETYEGWQNLQRLVSEGYRGGFYYKPRVSHFLLRKHAKGLIATSACLKGEVAQQIIRERNELAEQNLLALREIFEAPYRESAEREKPHFFVEVQANDVPAQRVANKGLLELARKHSIPLVGTGDVHYLRKEDKKAQDVLVCINTGKLLSDENRMRMDEAELYFRSKPEMAAKFDAWELPREALEATAAIAARCSVDLEKEQFNRPRLPRYAPPRGADGAVPEVSEFFRELCLRGLERRYGKPLAELPEAVRARYEEELGVVKKMGFESYLLIVYDFIDWAKNKQPKEKGPIPVGPGRGSAAGSLLCYAIGITDLDPLAYDLLFERFLNKERVSMPDIDVDFCQERRGEVIEYVREKYGRDAVAQIITFGTMAAKSVIRDVGRVLGMPLPDVDRIAKLVPGDLQVRHKKLRDAYEEVPDLAALRKDPKHEELFSIAECLEGFVRNCSTHAAGVVIGDGPLENRVPLYVDPKSPGEIVTQFPMTLLENECGLIKMDFLGLKTLTVIKWCLDAINASRARDGLPPLELSADREPLRSALRDPQEPSARRLYELLCRGETKGVFQFESSGYRDLLVKLRPDGFEDIIALGAMYRPGPLGAGMVDAYVNRKHGREPVTYLHPLLEQVLGATYGCMLYQEQIMRITNVLAGFTLSEADTLRKAMGKKKPEIMAKYKAKFIEGAGRNGCEAPAAEKIWEQMEFFAGYGFNRSHSAAYGLVTFQTAWLKANYPAEFMAALLSSEVADIDTVVEYVDEAERMGLEVLPPDVNHSDLRFSVVPSADGRKAIRYGLIAIRGAGEKAIHAILEARARAGRFETLHDFCAEVDSRSINKALVEALVKAGAFASLGARRSQLLAVAEGALQHGAREQADRRAGQRSIFDALGPAAAAGAAAPKPKLPDLEELPDQEILAGEKECLGYYLTTHPLKKHRATIARYATATAKSLAELAGKEVIVGGLVAEVRTRPDKTGAMMAFLSIEDQEGRFDGVVFSRTYEALKAALVPDAILFFRGSVDTRREQPSLVVNEVIPLDQADRTFATEVRVALRGAVVDDMRLSRLATALATRRGSCPVTVDLETRSGIIARVRVGRELYVEPGPDLVRAVEEVVGPGSCRIFGALGGGCAGPVSAIPQRELAAAPI